MSFTVLGPSRARENRFEEERVWFVVRSYQALFERSGVCVSIGKSLFLAKKKKKELKKIRERVS